MPTYVLLSKWTDQGIRTVKVSVARSQQLNASASTFGARLIGSWWTQGAYDGVNVIEFPDDETASAAALTLGMIGNVRTELMRAFTAEEMQRILEKLP